MQPQLLDELLQFTKVLPVLCQALVIAAGKHKHAVGHLGLFCTLAL